jgi:hypothetical protein
MSRRRRSEREPGRVHKTIEVLVSGLFGMAVVGVVVLILQGGSTPAPAPTPSSTVSGQAFPTGGADGGLVSVRSADPGTIASTGGVNSAGTGSAPSSPAEGAQGAQETGRTEPATPTTAAATRSTATGGSSSTGTSSGTAAASPSASASSTGGALGGLVGGLVGGVLGLL